MHHQQQQRDAGHHREHREQRLVGAGAFFPGAAALDLAYVACGRLDGYFEFGLQPWDVAAGALLVELPVGERPPVIVGGVLPLNLPAPDLAPFGMGLPPLGGLAGRIRNGFLNALTARLFAPVNAAGAEIGRRALGREPRIPVMQWLQHADAIAQLSVPSFEYPRPDDVAAQLRFLGPVSVSGAVQHALPEWTGRPARHRGPLGCC